jgi:hypothetical protein
VTATLVAQFYRSLFYTRNFCSFLSQQCTIEEVEEKYEKIIRKQKKHSNKNAEGRVNKQKKQ